MDYFRNEVEDRHVMRTYVLQQESQLLRDAEKALQWQNAAGTAVVTVDTTNRRLDLASTWAGDNKAMTLAVIGIGKILLLIATLLIENIKHK